MHEAKDNEEKSRWLQHTSMLAMGSKISNKSLNETCKVEHNT